MKSNIREMFFTDAVLNFFKFCRDNNFNGQFTPPMYFITIFVIRRKVFNVHLIAYVILKEILA